MMSLLADTTFWSFLGLIAFFALLFFMGVHKTVGNALDSRAETIRKELDEARRLREEAQERLASYERRQQEAADEAEEIIRQARQEAEYLRNNAKKEIAQRIERRRALAERRIEQAEASAIKEIRQRAADLAVDAAGQLMQSKLSKAQRNAIVKDDLTALKDRLN
ncbi:F0F1 ATP synthase subunit B family protein [Marinicauda pacifica]|jgi:F-type H+-transporting ATPase subunit b|uniref:F0F1 ATP synthase subunit B family protein n=1 Tax=Marinicauda pacifica TaxID=1133559 RepID=UPI0035C7ADE3